MTLSWQISIIDDLIKEDEGATIKDYFLLLADIEQIENAEKENDMPKPPIPMEKKEEILRLAATQTVKEIRKGMGITHSTVYRILREMGYYSSEEKDKRREILWREREAEKIAIAQRELDQRLAAIKKLPTRAKPVAPKIAPKQEEPKPFVRVKGEYSNAGSIQTTQKYAI